MTHFNHGLRGVASDADQAFVAELAREHGLELAIGHDDVRDHAILSKQTLEAAARELRYRWLRVIAQARKLDAIATGHTLDDQAETVLLKFLRGAGTRGLAGIYPEVTRPGEVRIVRPLLAVTRAEAESYLASLGQAWREDESNLDPRFARNRVRHELLPLLEREYNPNLRQVLSDTAEVARAEEEYWQALAERELVSRQPSPQGSKPGSATAGSGTSKAVPFQTSSPEQCLGLINFAALPLALQRRLLRQFAGSRVPALDFEHVEKLRRCALGESAKTELPGGWLATRKAHHLELCLPRNGPAGAQYEYTVPVPGEVAVPEIGATIRAMLVKADFARESESGSLLNAGLVGAQVLVRNWRPGDRFWPAHSAAEEKLKRLFAEKHIAAEQRPTWPVILCGDQIIWVRGFPVARSHAWQGGGDALHIAALDLPPAKSKH